MPRRKMLQRGAREHIVDEQFELLPKVQQERTGNTLEDISPEAGGFFETLGNLVDDRLSTINDIATAVDRVFDTVNYRDKLALV